MSQTPEVRTRTEVRDGMRITWHQPIAMDDGIVLRADVYRPIAEGRFPVILSHGVYAKGLAYQDGYPMQWQEMVADHPEILRVQTRRQLRRSDQIAKHYGQLPAFALSRRGFGWRCARLRTFDRLRKNRLCSGCKKVGMNGELGLFGPDQNLTVLIHRQPLCVHKFELQVLKARVIQFEYPAERAARHALLALEQGRRQRQ